MNTKKANGIQTPIGQIKKLGKLTPSEKLALKHANAILASQMREIQETIDELTMWRTQEPVPFNAILVQENPIDKEPSSSNSSSSA